MRDILRLVITVCVLSLVVLDIHNIINSITQSMTKLSPSKESKPTTAKISPGKLKYMEEHKLQLQQQPQHQWKELNLKGRSEEELSPPRFTLAEIVQEFCLPKLVCELHASLSSQKASLTQSENVLIDHIKETSAAAMGLRGESSPIHFAAHMGQLLSGIEGGGCHYLYSNCPLSAPQIKRLAKNIKLHSS